MSALDRMRRQAILSRYAALDGLSLPTFCRHGGHNKVVFPDRTAAEGFRDEVEQAWPTQSHQWVYLCPSGQGHFHLTTARPEQRAS